MNFSELNLAFAGVGQYNGTKRNLAASDSFSSWLACDCAWIPIVTVSWVALSDIAQFGVVCQAGAGSVGRAGLGERGLERRKAWS